MLERFRYQSSQIRVEVIDGEPWFVAKDVCAVLEIGNTSDAVRRLDDDEFDSIEVTDTLGRKQPTYVVSEAGLYSLILGSRKPEARQFKRWVTHDVLPSLRQTGSFEIQKPKSVEDLIIMQAQSMKAMREQMNEVSAELAIHKHRLDTLDHVDVIGDKQQRLVAMVKRIAQQNGWTFQHAWREFTASFNTAYRTNLTQRIEHYKSKHGLKELTRPQYLSMVEQLDDALRVADKMHNPVGV